MDMERVTSFWYNKNSAERSAILTAPNHITFNRGESNMTNSEYKTCRKCGQEKPVESFPMRYKKAYREHTCGMCKKRAHAAKNREAYLLAKREETIRRRAKQSGLSVEEFQAKQAERIAKQQQVRDEREAAYEAWLLNPTISPCRRTHCPVVARDHKIMYTLHRDKITARCRAYYAANTERARAKVMRWKAANPAKLSAQHYRRRTNLASAIVDLTEAQWEAIKAAYKYRCAYCRRRTKLTQEHVIPVSKGGHHT